MEGEKYRARLPTTAANELQCRDNDGRFGEEDETGKKLQELKQKAVLSASS